MFIFPWYSLNDKIKITPNERKEDKLEIFRTDHMRYMNVPFAINVMAGGEYEENKNIRFGGISDGKKFTSKQWKETDGEPDDGNMVFPDEWGIKMHQHDYYELMYVLKGEVKQQIEGSTYLYQKGEGCFVNRNTKHCEISGNDFFVVYLCLSKEYIRKILEETGKKSGVIYRFLAASLEEKAIYKKDYLHISTKEDENGLNNTYQLFEQMTKELLQQKPGYLYIFHGLVERLFGELQDKNFHQLLHVTLASSVEEQLFEHIKSLIEENPGKYSRQELANELNYSGDYLNRIVKKFSGYTITRYCQKIALQQARTLLIETEKSVASVMEDLGFKNSTHFYELYKEEFGVLPSESRKEQNRNV